MQHNDEPAAVRPNGECPSRSAEVKSEEGAGRGQPDSSPPSPDSPPAAPAAPAGPALSLRRVPPSFSSAGDAVSYGVVVRNSGTEPALRVRLEHDLPAGGRYLAAEPPATAEGGKLTWNLGRLDPNAESPVRVVLDITESGEAFDLSTPRFRAAFQKQAPVRLAVRINHEAAVAKGDEVVLTIEVTNTGGSPATQVQLCAELPPGLQHPSGSRVTLTHPTVLPNKKLRITVRTTAIAAGDQPVIVTVTVAEGLQEQAQTVVRVTQPCLSLRLAGPPHIVLGRQTEFRLIVANEGTADAANVRVTGTLPEELQFISADESVHCAADGQEVVWSVGTLAESQQRALTLTLAPRLPGAALFRVVASADRAVPAEAEMSIRIDFADDSPEATGRSLLSEILLELDQAGLRGESAGAELAPEPIHTRGRGEGTEHVVFTLAGTDYAVPITNVQEIGRPLPITPVPNVPDWLLGVSNVRGDIVSMVDLRQFLGLSRADQGPNGRLLVVRAHAEELGVGLLVDRVRGIRALKAEEVAAPTSPVDDRVTPYLRGVSERDDRLLAVLDLDRLLLGPEMRQFESV